MKIAAANRTCCLSLPFIVTTLVSIACSNQATVPEFEIHITRISPSEADVERGFYFVQPRAIIRIGDTLFAGDYSRSEIQMYSVDGNPIGIFGSEGYGPGEIVALLDMQSLPSQRSLYVLHRSGNRIDRFSADGSFIDGFYCPVSTPVLGLLPDGQGVALSTEPSESQGGVILCSLSGEILKDFSPPLEVNSNDITVKRQSTTVVVCGSEIWQFWNVFNHVRVFSTDGKMLREFPIRDSLIEAMDTWNTSRMNAGSGRAWMVTCVRAHEGSVWICAIVSPALSEDLKHRLYFFKVGSDGKTIKRYYLNSEDLSHFVMDIQILDDSDTFRAVLAIVREPYLYWVESSN
jgi:hypothetical protein